MRAKIVIFILVLATGIYAQDTVLNRSVVVERDYQPIIQNAGKVNAAPELFAGDLDAALIHEAAIGKVAGEQILKLRTLGLSEEDAEKAIIDGFLR